MKLCNLFYHFQYKYQSVVQGRRAFRGHLGQWSLHKWETEAQEGRRDLPKPQSQCLRKAGLGTRTSCLSLSLPAHQPVTAGVCPQEWPQPGQTGNQSPGSLCTLKNHLLGSCTKAFCTTWKVKLAQSSKGLSFLRSWHWALPFLIGANSFPITKYTPGGHLLGQQALKADHATENIESRITKSPV